MAEKRIEDFGERIYGAKKHLAELGRFLRSEDISEWTTQEREQLINKNQVWKKPDYQQMYDSGTPREVVYFIKKIRDSLPAKPARANEEYQKGYIDFVGCFRDKAMELQTTAEIERFHQDAVLTSPYVKDEGVYHYPRYSATPEAYGCMTNKFFKAAQSSLSSVQSEIRKKEFLYSEDEKLLKSYRFFSYNGSNAYSDENQKGRDGKPAVVFQKGCSKWYLHSQSDDFRNPKDWQENTYIAVKGSEIVGIDFPSLEDAQKSALEHERENQKENPAPEQTRKKGKQKLTPPQLSHIQRDGCDYREGADAVEDNYLKELGFRGVQFGNWENQNDRQTNMNMAYDAMKDLAEVLNISDSDVSLGNQLALAFGARGSGNAAAHYEPLENVINLTKMSGAGSLAHEWGHALDKFIQENTSSEEAVRKHLEEDIYQRFSDEFIERTKQTLSAQSENCYFATEDKFSIMQSVVQAMKYKTDQDGRKIETDFLKDAQKLDGAFSTSGNQKGSTEKGYWSSDVELFARAFECYVMDKLAEQGMRNDYLCGHAERTLSVQDKKENSHTVRIHPTGEERKAINSEIDKVFEELRELGLMHENTGQSRTQEYIRTDFEIKPKQTKANESHEPELPVEQNQTEQSVQKATEQPVQENTEEKQLPEKEMVKKEPAVAVHSIQITQSTNDLLKQISSGASPALVNAVIRELDRRIDAEKENVSSEDVEELFQYANINIDFSVDGTAHSYESSPCEIGGYDRISLTEQVKFDVQYETEILQRHPDSVREQEMKAVRDFLIPALEQSEELSKPDKETLDRLFAEYDRQKAQ